MMSRKFYIPHEEKLLTIRDAINLFHQLLSICAEYRNVAIEKGATQEDLDSVTVNYVDEDIDEEIEMVINSLNRLYFNGLASASLSAKKTETTRETGAWSERPGIAFLCSDLHCVSLTAKRDFIRRFIDGGEDFPVDEGKNIIKQMDYPDFLKTPYWKAISLYVKEKAGKKCSICGSTKALQTHHKTYDHHGDELHHLEDLVCVCNECHGNLHNDALPDNNPIKAKKVGSAISISHLLEEYEQHRVHQTAPIHP